MNKKLLALYGLKFNPFSPELPVEALYVSTRVEAFAWRLENTLIREGGFALISGEPGTGKSQLAHAVAHVLVRDGLVDRGGCYVFQGTSIRTCQVQRPGNRTR